MLQPPLFSKREQSLKHFAYVHIEAGVGPQPAPANPDTAQPYDITPNFTLDHRRQRAQQACDAQKNVVEVAAGTYICPQRFSFLAVGLAGGTIGDVWFLGVVGAEQRRGTKIAAW